jgi:rhomboid family GlyGly-CTERM serine protease
LRAVRSEAGIIRAASCPTPVRTLRLSPPERAAIAVAIALLALHAFALGDALEYQRGALARQPWRVLTGHLVHVNWPHALINAAALWIVARLYAPDLSATRQAIALAASALAISAALAWLYPAIEWYRGLSGALHGLFFAGAATWLLTERPRSLRRLWLPVALLAGGWVKVVFEQPVTNVLPYANWLGTAIVPQAHLAGAVCGTALGALFAATQARAGEQRREQ